MFQSVWRNPNQSPQVDTHSKMKLHLLIALGGNAIKQPHQTGTSDEQFESVTKATAHIAQLIKDGYTVTISHGNGPQIGNLLIQNEAAKDIVPPLTMDVCGAESQGQIGYMIQQTLTNHLQKMKFKTSVVSLITQMEVDAKDKAFQNPSKPVGPFYGKDEAEKLQQQGFTVVEDAGRGYRRVVPSPTPIKIVELEAIKSLIKNNVVVICAGGGGVPVIRKNENYHGVEAVIDKDLASELVAEEIGADVLIILTDIEKVAINFNQPNQTFLDAITAKEAEQYMTEGHFAKGSMGPKVQAAINFVKKSGKKAIITELAKVKESLDGKTGTTIVK